MIDAALDIGADVHSATRDTALLAALAAAARAASHALDVSRPESLRLLQTLDTFVVKVKASHVDLPQDSNESIREVVHSFRTKYNALRDGLDSRLGRAATELSGTFAKMESDAAFVTLMLFGRTRAGKSTTMEALTGGDGATMGVGRQHTTTEIRTY